MESKRMDVTQAKSWRPRDLFGVEGVGRGGKCKKKK
jgi:hypothetical protein